MTLDFLILLTVACNIILSVIVFLRNPKRKENRLFAVFVTFLNIWIISNFLENEPTLVGTQNLSMFLRLDFAFAIFLVYAWFRFCSEFSKINFLTEIKYRWLNRGILFFSLLIGGLSLLTSLIIKNISFYDNVIHYETGVFWFLYAVLLIALVIGGIILLIVGKKQARKSNNALKAQQIDIILIGFCISIGGAILVNLFLQTFFPISLEISRLGLYGMIFLVAFTAYAITARRLFDLKIIIARTISYVSVIVIFAIIYSFILLWLVKKFISIDTNLLIVFLLLMVITTLTFQPLAEIVRKLTNKLFFKARYDTEKLLGTLTKIMASTINLDSMVDQILSVMVKEMNLTKAALLYIENHTITDLKSVGFHDHELVSADFEKVIFHRGTPTKIILDEIEEGDVKELLRKFDINAAIPLNTKDKEIAILILGSKASGEPYFKQDLTFLDILVPQAAIAIQNALAFKQLLTLDEAKSEFVRVVSHQLRTPLSVARWNIELILEGITGKIRNLKTREAIETTYEGLSRLNEGLNNLITAMEIAEGDIILQKRKLDFIDEIVIPVKEELAQKMRSKNMTVKIMTEMPYSKIEADPNKIHYVFKTLLFNAITYGRSGTPIKIFINKNGKELGVAVEDQGIGIPPENRENIFAKFWRGDEARIASPDGLGLSLNNSRSFIEAHGGKLWTEDKKDKSKPGARFVFTLPLIYPKS